MEPAEYQRLQEFESGYWWYVAQRSNLLDAVARLPLRPGARMLDAGCGTGRNLRELTRNLKCRVYGIDVSLHAATHWNHTGAGKCAIASLNDLPFADECFDAVVSVDVLGCRGVQISKSMKEIARVLRSNGHLVMLVPAYQWMRSRHDRAVHSVHRFTRRELHGLSRDAGLTVWRLTHRFALLFPLIAGIRLWRKRSLDAGTASGPMTREQTQRPHEWVLDRIDRKGGPKLEPNSDLTKLPVWLNGALRAVSCWEQRALGRFELPWGSTILLVARKKVKADRSGS